MARIKKVIIFDIDGTLSDNSHRQHFVRKRNPDWKKFFEEMSKDTLNRPIVQLYQLIKESSQYEIILVSARPEKYRDMTKNWLKENSIDYRKLYLRPDGDRRADHKVKKDILDEILETGREIIFVVDDRSQTVKMWRENGLTCLQCADHNF